MKPKKYKSGLAANNDLQRNKAQPSLHDQSNVIFKIWGLRWEFQVNVLFPTLGRGNGYNVNITDLRV